MIYLSDTYLHPGLFGLGEYDVHVREVDFWAVRAALRTEPAWTSAVRADMAAAFIRGQLGRDAIQASDEEVWLTPDDALYVATLDNPSAPTAVTWQEITVAPFWRD